MSPRLFRPLGNLEKYQISKQLTEVYGTVAITVHLRDDALSSLTFVKREQHLRSRLYPILSTLCDEFVNLTLGVIDLDTPNPTFVCLETINFSQVVRVSEVCFTDEEKLSQYLEAEKRETFDLNDLTTPLWRLTILLDPIPSADFSLSFSFDHVIADGQSAIAFWQRLIALSSIPLSSSPEKSLIFHPKAPTSIPLPFEDRVKTKPGILDLIPIVISTKLLPTWAKDLFSTNYWAGHTPARHERHCTKCIAFSIPLEKYIDLCDRAREEGTTSHAAIYIASVISLLETITNHSPASASPVDPNDLTPITFRTSTPISARNFLKPELQPGELGNFVGAVTIDETFPELFTAHLYPSFWLGCRAYKHSLEESRLTAIKGTGLLAYVGEFPHDWENFWLGKLKHSETSPTLGRNSSLEISNLGRLIFEEHHHHHNHHHHHHMPWEVVEAWFSQSVQLTGAAIVMSFVSVKGGLYGTVTWQNGGCDERFMKEFVKRFKEILEEVVTIE